LKIIDFGVSKQFKLKVDLTQSTVGSPLTIAPEVLSGQMYGLKADIYSFGVILFVLLKGEYPYRA
jgi:serine/threonine protein kinase